MPRILISNKYGIDVLSEKWFSDISVYKYWVQEGRISACFADLWRILDRIKTQDENTFYLGVQEHVNFAPIREEINSLLKNVTIVEHKAAYIDIRSNKIYWPTNAEVTFSESPTNWKSVILKISMSPEYNFQGKAILLKLLGVILRSTSPLTALQTRFRVVDIMTGHSKDLKSFLKYYYTHSATYFHEHNISQQEIFVNQIRILDDVHIVNKGKPDYFTYASQSNLWDWLIARKKENTCPEF